MPKKLKVGDIINLQLVRVPIYADDKHIPSYRETTKRFVVRSIGKYGYSLRPTVRAKKARGWRLALSLQWLTSSTKPPLRYEVMSIDLAEAERETRRTAR